MFVFVKDNISQETKSYASSKTASRTVAESNSAGVGKVGKEAEGGHLGGGVDGDEQ